MRRWKKKIMALAVLIGCAAPAGAWAQGADTDVTDPNSSEQTDEGDESAENGKSWAIAGSLTSRVGQGTFVSLENDAGVEGTLKGNGTAYDRANLIYSLSPSYQFKEFTFGAEFQLVQWLTAGGGTSTLPVGGGANDPADVYFQDTELSAAWQGHTFDSIGLTLAPSLSVGLPTSKASQISTKYFDISTNLSLSKTFFEKLTLQGIVGFTKYFHKYQSPAISADTGGEGNVLFRAGGAEDIGDGNVIIGGYNTSHVLSFGGVTSINIWESLSGSISYVMVNFYSYPGNREADEYTAEYAQPKKNFGQAISTSVQLSYGINDYLSVSGGIGSYMSPKTSDNQSFRFPFWNMEGAAANRSWMTLGVSGQY